MIRRLPLLASVLLAACASATPETTLQPPAGEVDRRCIASAAQSLIGQKATADIGAQALALTRARSLRWGPPRSAFTMDYREDRVNVMYDDAMTVTEVTCG